MRRALPVAVYTLAWLAVLDVLLGFVGRYPDDPRVEPNGLQRYLDYGRSVEGKLRQMVADTPETSAPIASSGWLDPREETPMPSAPSLPAHVLVACDGQSFTHHLLEGVHEVDARFEVRLRGGPGAPLSHSFAMYQMDRGRHEGKVVVLGLLASSLPQLASMSNMTSAFEAPQPFTYPRYMLRDGALTAVWPSVRTFEQLRTALAEPARFRKLLDELARHDLAYQSMIFEQDWLDASTFGRLLRRGLGQRHARAHGAKFVGPAGFANHAQILDVAEAILREFAVQARRDGDVPYALLIHDRYFGDSLYRALGPRLERIGLPYFSTHEIVPPTNARLFLKDGHFTPQANRALASELRDRLRAQLDVVER